MSPTDCLNVAINFRKAFMDTIWSIFFKAYKIEYLMWWRLYSVYISHGPGNGHWSWFHLTQQKEQCLERSGNSEEQFPGRDQTTLTFIQYHPQHGGSISFVYTLHTLERQLSRSFLVQMESRSPSKHSLMTQSCLWKYSAGALIKLPSFHLLSDHCFQSFLTTITTQLYSHKLQSSFSNRVPLPTFLRHGLAFLGQSRHCRGRRLGCNHCWEPRKPTNKAEWKVLYIGFPSTAFFIVNASKSV